MRTVAQKSAAFRHDCEEEDQVESNEEKHQGPLRTALGCAKPAWKIESTHVLSHYAADASAADAWRSLAKRDLTEYQNLYLRVESNELFACLAVLKKLADQVNVSLQATLGPSAWASVAVGAFTRNPKPGNPDQVTRRLLGFVSHNYGLLQLPKEAVLAAVKAQELILG